MADTNGKTKMFHIIEYIIPRMIKMCAIPSRVALLFVCQMRPLADLVTYGYDLRLLESSYAGTETFGSFRQHD